MNVENLWKELVRRNRLLAFAGLISALLFLILAVVSLFDSTTIMGINRWIKPMKFSISIAVYLWTIAWLAGYLEDRAREIRYISLGLIITMISEIVPIVGQAARGRLSHFNISSPFDGAVFSFMGIMIALNTLLSIYLLVLFLRSKTGLSPALLWGIRIGLLLFIIFSAEGALMAAWLTHSVGVRDGGPGLPFVNWSTRGGDLRAAHFFGIHALQALPVAATFFDRIGSRPVIWTALFGAGYAVIAAALFVQAMLGAPLIGLN